MADYYEELCPHCENNYLLIYLCEECHAVFCGDCLQETTREELICYNCGRSDLEQNKSGKFHCKKCNSENIISEKRTVPACPNCGESSVVKIISKVESLKEGFQNVVQNSGQYLKPLEEQVNSLNLIRQELINLRENKLRINHFPQIEMQFLQIIKLFDNIKEATEKKTIDFFDDINRNLKYFAKINQLQPKVLPIVSAIQESFEKTSDDNLSFITESLHRLDDRIESLGMKINFMTSIKSLFMEYFQYIDMSEEEKPVFGLKCKLDTGENKQNEFNSTKGTILLTDKRIYFLHEKGIIRKRTVLLFSVLLDDLEAVNVEGTFSKKLTLEFANSMYKFKLNKEKRSQIIDFIEKARVFNSNKIDTDSLLTLKQVEISIGSFRESLDDAIFTIIGYCTGRFTLESELNPELNQRIEQNNDRNQQVQRSYGEIMHENNNWSELAHNSGDIALDRHYTTEDNGFSSPYRQQESMAGHPTHRQPRQNNRYREETPEHLQYLFDLYAKRPVLHDLERQNWQYQALKGHGANIYPTEMQNNPIFNPYAAPEEYYEPHYLPSAPNPNFRQNAHEHQHNTVPRNSPSGYPAPQEMYANQYENYPQNIHEMGKSIFDDPRADQAEHLHSTFRNIQNRKSYSNYRNPDYNTGNTNRNEQGSHNSINRSIKNRVLSSKLRQHDLGNQQRDPWMENTQNRTQKYARKKNMRKNRSVLDGLMSIFPEETEKEEFVPRPQLRRQEFIPKTSLDQRIKPRSYAETLMKLEEREFSLKRTIEMLKLRRKRNKISENEYIEQFQNLQANLFSVQKKIQQIQSRI